MIEMINEVILAIVNISMYITIDHDVLRSHVTIFYTNWSHLK